MVRAPFFRKRTECSPGSFKVPEPANVILDSLNLGVEAFGRGIGEVAVKIG